jgi:hypothetical protein
MFWQQANGSEKRPVVLPRAWHSLASDLRLLVLFMVADTAVCEQGMYLQRCGKSPVR